MSQQFKVSAVQAAPCFLDLQAGIKKAKAVGSRIKQAAKTGQSYQVSFSRMLWTPSLRK